MKYVFTLLALTVGVAVGVAAIVYGEADDSSGLQGLGALIVVCLIALGVREARKQSRRDAQSRPNSHRPKDMEMPE